LTLPCIPNLGGQRGRSLSGLSDAIGEALRWRDASPLSQKFNHALFGGLRGAFVPEIDREH